jgi:hypothetical protein
VPSSRSASAPFVRWLACLLLATGSLAAQQVPEPALTVSAGFPADRFVESQASVTLVLSRTPTPADGRVAVFVGSTDLTAQFEPDGATLVYRARGIDLPAGASQVKVFLVQGVAWTEVAALPIRVRTPRGFEQALVDPAVDLRNTGQLAAGHSGAAPASNRPTFQTLDATVGVHTSHVRDGFTLVSDVHLLAVGERPSALRFAELGDRASRLDLADYLITLEGRGTKVSMGQISTGMNRHLISAFTSRGVVAQGGGPRARWTAGAANGTALVGTDNLVGVGDPHHRVATAELALELLPQRPGAMHVDVTVLQGVVRAISGFNSGGIVSADESRGAGVQLAASTPSQRVRFAAGLSGSRSQYAADPPLSSGGSTVESRAQSKGARHAELTVGLLQHRPVVRGVPVTLNVTMRHEQVDPLYRSVALFLPSDMARNGIDLGGTVDAVSVQAAYARGTDNIDDIASLLTNRTRQSSLTVGAPLAAMLRVTQRPALWPTVSYALQRMHGFGAGVPVGGVYTAFDIPDLLSTVHDASAQWQVRNWQVAYRVNASCQDNRQLGREHADLTAQTQAVTLGVTLGATASMTLDLGRERQENREFSLVNHLRRAAVTGTWRPSPLMSFDAAATISRSDDHGTNASTHVSSVQAGVSRTLVLWRATPDTPRGQVFLRAARQSSDLYALLTPFALLQPSGMWTLSSGLTLRLF